MILCVDVQVCDWYVCGVISVVCGLISVCGCVCGCVMCDKCVWVCDV